MDLVDEEHLMLIETGKDRRQIASVLDRGPGGDSEVHAQLVGDDHRQRRLAEAWRTRQQHVIRGGAAMPGRVQHQRELLPDTWLATELVEEFRAQRCLEVPIFERDLRIDW